MGRIAGAALSLQSPQSFNLSIPGSSSAPPRIAYALPAVPGPDDPLDIAPMAPDLDGVAHRAELVECGGIEAIAFHPEAVGQALVMHPGRRDGVPVDVYFTIIVEFDLQ